MLAGRQRLSIPFTLGKLDTLAVDLDVDLVSCFFVTLYKYPRSPYAPLQMAQIGITLCGVFLSPLTILKSVEVRTTEYM